MRLLTLHITEEMAGRKVGHLLRGELGLSYSLVKSLKWRENAILLNGEKVNTDVPVKAGDVLTVNVADREEGAAVDETVPLPKCCGRMMTCSSSTRARVSPSTPRR